MRRAKYLMQWLFACFVLIGSHAWAQDSVTYVYTDPQGTPLAEADASGNITATFEYTPYGTYAPQGTSKPGPTPTGPGYTGHVNDPETNLVYMQARYYDPSIGRFISTDPTPPAVGNTFNFNRFAYTNNNPLVNIDPDGKQTTFDAALWLNQANLVKDQNPKGLQQAAEINAAQAKAIGVAMMGVAAAPAAGFVATTVTSTAVDVLTTGSLASGIMLNGFSLVASGTIVTEGVAAANGVNAPFSPMSLEADGEAILNAAQSSNLNRFNNSLPTGNTGTYVDRLGSGVVFTATVPGRVAGSSAVYQKTVDNAGKTSGFLKTTFAPNGSIIHIKDKINNTIIHHDH